MFQLCNQQLSEERLEQMGVHIFEELSKMKVALVVVDFQNDFISGSLSVQEGTAHEDPLKAIPLLNSLISEKRLDLTVYTLDWHPANHISFLTSASDSDRKFKHKYRARKLEAFDVVTFKQPNTQQVLYPSHCVQNSWGAELHADLEIPDGAKFIKKGTQTSVDSYSALSDNNGSKLLELEELLKSNGISAVLVCGLAFDICVRHTVIDANNLGFLSGVVRDCSAAFSAEHAADTIKQLQSEDIAIVDSLMAKRIIRREAVPTEWICQLMDHLDSRTLEKENDVGRDAEVCDSL
ncbi:unnamed protein product [Heligmosomoides polygyrus]|uniref:nicotinamidase n=1 Tax=Heligmosomoides polygyrus TaxID=6339 RepID=A0A183FH74_HELPZ|nr:unnamed protein product [Heligmosomoides polygyrus]